MAAGYFSSDSIYALSTPVGAAIAILRISGPKVPKAIAAVTKRPEDSFAARRLYRVELYGLKGNVIDDAMCVKFSSPKSYTGEDMFEFYIHGGPAIADLLAEHLQTLGFRQAMRGEFSFRAVKSGKLALSQAQAVADVISAQNESALTIALEKLAGSQHQLIKELGEQLRRLATLSEVGIDFSDQDVDEVKLQNLKADLSSIQQSLVRLSGSFKMGQRIQQGVSVALIGLPNAGKSSLFNVVLGEERSIVSNQAGTTRDTIRETITLKTDLNSVTFRFEDTAGLRKAEGILEEEGIKRSKLAAAGAELLVWVVDGQNLIKGENREELEEVFREFAHKKDRIIGVLSKVDLLTEAQVSDLKKKLMSQWKLPWVAVSASKLIGVNELISSMIAASEKWVHHEKGEVILTRRDHFVAVETASRHLERAQQSEDEALFASDVRQGLAALAPLIGETVTDDILGRIFSEFCIGK